MNDPIAETVSQLLVVQAERLPEHTAIRDEGESLSYSSLTERVERMSQQLRAMGAEPDVPVAVVPSGALPAVVELLAGMAIAPCVPLNPQSTEYEMTNVLQRTRPGVVIAADNAAATGAARKARIPVWESSNHATGAESSRVASGTARTSELSGYRYASVNDPALILSTSGTTATPKLVPLTHYQAIAGAAASTAAYQLTAADTRLNVMPLSHVQGLVGSLLTELFSGGTFWHVQGFDPSTVLALLAHEDITWMSATSAMWRNLCEYASPGPITNHLRFLRCGSGALPLGLREELQQRLNVPVIESYGLTEAHQVASTPLIPAQAKPGAVGPPTGSEVHIHAEDGTSAAPGQVGEIWVRGPNVATGYFDDPSLTCAAFDPAGWFRTGDLGFLDEDSYLTLVGRWDEVINCGGEKVSPLEIEESLADYPDIAEIAVFAIPNALLGQVAAAAIVPHQGADIDFRTLRSYAARRVAPYKLPRHIVKTESLPRTANGKISRRLLYDRFAADIRDEENRASAPTPLVPEPPRGDEYNRAAEQETVTRVLAVLWREVLSLDSVAPEDDFFEIGGDSLSGVKLLSKAQEIFGVELSPLDMYDQASTPSRMAAEITRARSRREES